MKRFEFLAASLLAAVLCAFAPAQGRNHGRGDFRLPSDAPPLLKRAMEASEKLKYSGTRVVEFRRGPDRSRFTEYVFRDGGKIKTEFPNDSPYAGQIIVENGDKRYHYYPDSNEIHVGRARRESAFRSLTMGGRRSGKLVLKFTSKPGTEVAGRATTLVVIADDKGNQYQRLWIDNDYALLLKRELLDPVGTVVGSYEFRQINFRPRFAPHEFEISRAGAVILSPLDLAKRTASSNGMLPVFLPSSSGMELESSRMMKFGEVEVFAQFYRGRDGSVSLFQFAGEAKPPQGRRPAEFNPYSWRMNGRTFSLVGRPTQDELKALARLLGDR